MVPFLALRSPSLLRFWLSRSHHDSPCRSPLLFSAFSLGMLLRYAHVTMSRNGRSSFFLSPKAPASVSSSPLAFAFGSPLPLASPSTGSPTVCHRSGQVGGSSWETSSRNVNASEGGGRLLPSFAGAGSFRSALAPCGRLVSQGSLTHSATTAWPNPAVEGTSEKLRFSVPRRLRRRAAPHLERWASCCLR